jgi:acyl-CoA dehydrogenase
MSNERPGIAMSNEAAMAAEALRRLLERFFAPAQIAACEHGSWPEPAWQALVELGMPTLLVPEATGGSGADWPVAAAVIATAAAHAAPLPLGETIVANALGYRIDHSNDVATFSFALASQPELVVSAGQARVTGSIDNVPWGRNAATVVVLVRADQDYLLAAVDAHELKWSPGQNLAGEPRDAAMLDGVNLLSTAAVDANTAWAAAALLRAIQLGAAMRAALDIAIAYARERIQFGKPIGQFQAIQHQLAVAAGEMSAAEIAIAAAIAAATGPQFFWRAAIAKARASEAAGIVAATAHQVLGALGFTREYHLQLLTRRLWSWRDEAGGEAWWQRVIGEAVLAQDPAELWPMILEETAPLS